MGRRPYRRSGLLDSRGLSSSGLRALGIMFIVIGLLVMSTAVISGGVDGEGMFIIFPFVFGNVGGWTAIIVTLMFFALFLFSSLFPWYMIRRAGGLANERKVIYGEGPSQVVKHDVMEYIITTELPGKLKKSIYIEADEESIHLKSTQDKGFFKSYTLPQGFEVDEINYNYEGNYLLLKLKLKRF